MTVFWVKRVGNTLHPADTDSADLLASIPFNKVLRAEVKEPRNAGRHRLYWAMVNRIAKAVGSDPSAVSDLLKIEAGWCHIIKSKKHGIMRLPKSIAWSRMDETAFSSFFEACVQTIFSEWGIERQDVLDAVSDLLEPKTERIGG